MASLFLISAFINHLTSEQVDLFSPPEEAHHFEHAVPVTACSLENASAGLLAMLTRPERRNERAREVDLLATKKLFTRQILRPRRYTNVHDVIETRKRPIQVYEIGLRQAGFHITVGRIAKGHNELLVADACGVRG
jgi:hypothetical protein